MMAAASPAAARRAQVDQRTREQTGARPSRLRLFQPIRRTRRRRSVPVLAVAVGMVAASLLAVVVTDDLVAQGKVELATVTGQISAAEAVHARMQTSIAEQTSPGPIVRVAETQLGMVAPTQITDLPEVPLDVPLPVPQTGNAGATASHAPAPGK